MGLIGDDQKPQEALERLRATVKALTDSIADQRHSAAEHDRLLSDLREAVRLAHDLLHRSEHQIRGPLTVVKGRAQWLRRHEVTATQPNLRLIAGLDEIDAAVERIVAHLTWLEGFPLPSDEQAPVDHGSN